MNIILSFIGKLPNYMVDCIHQIRCFSSSPIFIIIDDLQSPYVSHLSKYDVSIINYYDVIDTTFLNAVNENFHKFLIIHDLGDRSHLFIRAFERFFLLHNLMKIKNLENCFFMEVDNLIYDDPNNWLVQFSKSELCYMYDNTNHFSSGIMYIKKSSSINGLLEHFLQFITTSTEFMSEMTCLSSYYEYRGNMGDRVEKDTNEIQLLPIYWQSENICELAYNNFNMYNTIFDAAAIGIFLLGENAFHNNGQVVIGKKNPHSAIDYTNHLFEWKKDEQGRNKPYIWNGERWLLINNLHIHSKELHNGLSIPL